ncbi:MAG: FAD-dependent oxidoreductase [Firmicutes bacterium]|nr:FAD-dependent oxidoreductase [Bacillota bacterium]
MNNRYSDLLSPIKIGNAILKNRMTSTASTPHFLQGVEPYPTEKFITHFANRAKNGAAAITINHLHVDEERNFGSSVIDNVPGHFNMVDLRDYSCQNYLCQMVDALHFYGALAVGYLNSPSVEMPDTEKNGGGGPMGGPFARIDITKITEKMIEKYVADIVEEAVVLKKLGFDMLSLHCCYRGAIHTRFLSSLTNERTDRWGGSLENRARFILKIFESIKNACGRGFPLECVISVSEPEGGYAVEEMIEFAKLAEGKIDILHLRAGLQDPQHPLGYTSTAENPTPYLAETAIVKASVAARDGKILIGASAGFQDLDWANKAIAEGKADLICMARSWIVDPEYGKKAYEGRGEDVVPCIRCNKCHVSNGSDSFRSLCSVNPLVGLEDKIDRMISAPTGIKKVAVIGGGPAGMKAAIVAAERGHEVTLFEKTNYLGGELKHADYASFKWPLKNFKDYLVRELYKKGVTVRLNTETTKAMLEGQGYASVIVAIGSEAVIPGIPGVDGDNVVLASAVFGKEAALAEKVVVIGGGEIGVETGMYLAELGHKVTVIEMARELIEDAPHAHYKFMVQDAWKKLDNFNSVVNARCMGIDSDGVRYVDKSGQEYKIEAGSVIIAVGTKPKTDEAMALFGTGAVTAVVGDCVRATGIANAMRTAFAAAVVI